MLVQSENSRILAIFSDVDFSPQLIGIIQKLLGRGAVVRVILIGNADLQIAKQIQLRGWDSRIIRQRGKIGSLLNFLFVALGMIKYRPQILFASGQYATIIGMSSAKLLNVSQRVYIRHHSSFHHKYKMKLGLILDRISNRLATTIVAVSSVVEKILIQDELVDKNKIVIIHNGVDLTNFRSESPLSKSVSPKNASNSRLFHIGVISRLTEWKGVNYTATAFVKLQKEFPNSRLHIVGAFADSYPDVKSILSTVDKGKYSLEKINSNIPAFLRGLDAFVHVPVGKDDEAFGIVYVEALASGIPCIFTQSGVLNELVTPDRYAHLVQFRNSEEIYRCLKGMMQGLSDPKIAVPEPWLNQFSLSEMSNQYAILLLGGGR
jgi:glycosyltransferase involved in cell wall biosynthesis